MVFRSDVPGGDRLRDAPLLVVEVSSPSTRSEDWGRQREVCATGGAPWYWLVDPDADTVTVLRRVGGRSTEVGSHDAPGVLELPEPFPVRLDLSALVAS